MGKQINVYFDEQNKRLVIIEDNVQKGDFIDLDSLSNFESFIKQQAYSQYKQQIIDSADSVKQLIAENQTLKQEVLKNESEKQSLESEKASLIQQQKVQLDNAKMQAVNDFKSHNQEYLNLLATNDSLKSTNAQLNAQLNAKNQEINEVVKHAVDEFKLGSEYNQLLNTINQLNIDKANLANSLKAQENNLHQQIAIAQNQAIEAFRQSSEYKELLEAQQNLKAAQSQKELALQQQKAELELERNKVQTALEYQIDKLKEENENIKLARSASNTKLLGERLEVECWENYNNSMGQFINDSIFKKATKEINGRKPDFIFDVYAHNLYDDSIKENPKLISAVLEMKTESLSSQEANKKKNKDHLEKLENDRRNNDADFAILVTELEANDEFIIKRDPNYPKIIIVRPMAMVPVLSLIRTIGLKNRDVQLQAIEFKNQQEIIDEFEEFKNAILENSLTNIKGNLETIIKHALSIENTARKIHDEADKALNRHAKTIENKINGFKIENKIIKKINNLETINPQPSLTSGIHTELDDNDILDEKIKIKTTNR